MLFPFLLFLSLPSAMYLQQGYVFTPVCYSVHGGCITACTGADTPRQTPLPDRHPSQTDTPPRQTPLPDRHPSQTDTPPRQTPLPDRHPQADTPQQTPPQAETPRQTPPVDTPWGRNPPGRHPQQTPPRQKSLGRHPPGRHLLQQIVRILLEYILV